MFHFHTKIPLKTGPVCLPMQCRHKLTKASPLGSLCISGHNCTSKFMPVSWNKIEADG